MPPSAVNNILLDQQGDEIPTTNLGMKLPFPSFLNNPPVACFFS